MPDKPNATRTAAQPEVRPFPPRYWWLKRIGLAAALLLVLLGVVRWVWGSYADRRLREQIEEYRAAGEPVLVQDFQAPPVPDEQNAAVLYRQAFSASVHPNDVPFSFVDVAGRVDVVRALPGQIERILEANAGALRLVRAARERPEVDWGIRPASPMINMMLSSNPPLRGLARLSATAVAARHVAGDDRQALEHVQDMLAMARAANDLRCPSVISHLVGVAIGAVASALVEQISPDLEVGEDGDRPERMRATRKQVRRIIEALLDDSWLRESWRHAMYFERAQAVDALRMLQGSPGAAAGAAIPAIGPGGIPALGPVGWVLYPMFQLDTVQMLQDHTRSLRAGLAEARPAARKTLPTNTANRNGLSRFAHILSQILMPSLERAAELTFRAIAERRMAALGLAIRLYEIDHGQRPETLDALVPEYLPGLPRDPFAAADRPIGYLRDDPQPRLYSVGANGVDEGGTYQLDRSGYVDSDVADLVFFLNGDRPQAPWKPPASRPSTRPASQPSGAP